MPTEAELYIDNVPHGDWKYAFGDWSSAIADIELAASTGKVLYVNSVGFIIDDGATITAGKFELKNDTTVIASVNYDATPAEDFTKLFALADPFSLKFMKVDATNEVVVGEIKLNPPVQVTAGNTFSIDETGLVITAGAVGPFFTIKGWEDTATT